MSDFSMKALLETGVHFGHRTSRWHPKMKPFIFSERNGIHIIDLQQTMECILRSYDIVRDVVSEGGEVLFVGTKRQAQEAIQTEAERCAISRTKLTFQACLRLWFACQLNAGWCYIDNDFRDIIRLHGFR